MLNGVKKIKLVRTNDKSNFVYVNTSEKIDRPVITNMSSMAVIVIAVIVLTRLASL